MKQPFPWHNCLNIQVQEYMMMTGASLYGIEQQLLFHTSQSH